MRIEALRGDITRQQVDAVVNAANEHLAGGGGVDGAIHLAAGAAALHEACRVIGHCDTGQAVATPGFGLPARWVIHTVGPRWRGGRRGEAALLASCYRRSLEVADGLGARSVAFPAISTGIYGYPADEAAGIAVRTLRDALTSVEVALLVAFDGETLHLYRRHLGLPAAVASTVGGVEILDEATVAAALEHLGWERSGDVLVKVVKRGDFAHALSYVDAVGALAEQAGHHPDIDIRWDEVTLRLTTHSAGGLTDKDLDLAAAIDSLGFG